MTDKTTENSDPNPNSIAGESSHVLIDHVPFAKALGMAITKFEPGRITAMVPYDEKMVGNPKTGVVHGGVITALLDNACGVAVGTSLTEPTSIATLDLRIDYMKPAEPGLNIYARAEAIKNTKSVAFVRATAFVEGREDDPIALASGSFMLAANRSGPPAGQIRDKMEAMAAQNKAAVEGAAAERAKD